MACYRDGVRPSISLTALFMAGQLLFAQQDTIANKNKAAHEALVTGRYSEAATLYRQMIALLPNEPRLRLNLAIALEKAGQPSAAIPELQQVTRAEPKLAGAWFLLGLAYAQLRRPREAIAPLKESLRLDSSNADAWLELADAELSSGDLAGAAHDFGELAARHPDLPKAWEGLGLAYVAQSERRFADIQRRDPQSAFGYSLLARMRAGEGETAEALRLYNQALQKSPHLPGLHAACAALFRATERPDLAAAEDGAEAHLPQSACGTSSSACYYRQQNWKAILDEEAAHPSLENRYWSSLAAAELAQLSFAHLSRLPASPESYEMAAESDQRSGRRLEAITEWRKALALDPLNPRLQGRLAESLYRAREYREAETLLKPLTAAHPENAEWQYLLGSDLFRQKRDEEALPYLVNASRLDPDFLPGRQNLGLVYLNLDQPAKAVEWLERALPLDDGAISFALSTAYRRLGRTEDARTALARYQKLQQKPSSTGPE